MDVVGSLQESKKAITETKYDLVLLDLNLPDSMGKDTFLEMLRFCCLNLPVVVISGILDEDIRQTAMNSGAQDVIDKADVLSLKHGDVFLKQLVHAVERQRFVQKLLETCDQISSVRDILRNACKD